MRKLIILSFLFFTAVCVYPSKYLGYPGFHVSPQGLMLSHWEINGPATGPSPRDSHPQGKPVEATFTLTNVTNQPLSLSQVYVASRYMGKAESTVAVQWRDFGIAKDVVLNPGESKTVHASLVLDKTGNWRFWPAYKFGDMNSPLRWHEAIVRVESKEAAAGAAGGVQVFKGPEVSDGLKVVNFTLNTPKNSKVGNFAVVDFDVTNITKAPIVLEPNGVFVAATAVLPTVRRDFGFKSVTLKPGQTVHVHAATKMDTSGLWHFWPGYKIHGGSSVPLYWNALSVAVQ